MIVHRRAIEFPKRGSSALFAFTVFYEKNPPEGEGKTNPELLL